MCVYIIDMLFKCVWYCCFCLVDSALTLLHSHLAGWHTELACWHSKFWGYTNATISSKHIDMHLGTDVLLLLRGTGTGRTVQMLLHIPDGMCFCQMLITGDAVCFLLLLKHIETHIAMCDLGAESERINVISRDWPRTRCAQPTGER